LPANLFRPQLWRVDLASVSLQRLHLGKPGWDEQLIADLKQREFIVMVE